MKQFSLLNPGIITSLLISLLSGVKPFLKEVEAYTIDKAILKDWIVRWGGPSSSNQIKRRISGARFFRAIWELWSIIKSWITMNHPERINLEECINRILKSVLKALIDKQSFCCWKRAVHHCLMTNWDSVHISTAQIPYFLVWECDLRWLTDLCFPDLRNFTVTAHDCSVAIEKIMHLGTSRQQRKSYYNLSDHGSLFDVDDCVMFSTSEHSICFCHWVGLSIIIKEFAHATFTLRRRGRPQSGHFNK